MKRELRTFIAFSIAAASIAALPAFGAESETLRVTVPFAFTAGAATLPAGDYVISQQMDGHFLTIGGKGGAAILVTVAQSTAGAQRMSNVTFERVGQTNTLMEIQMNGKPSIILNHPVRR